MNLSSYSEGNNREMGFLISTDTDAQLFAQVEAEVRSILISADEVEIDNEGRWHAKENARGEDEGYCIRCQDIITFEPGRPYCYRCYRQWTREGEYADHRERHCHACGGRFRVSLEKPLCYDCYREYEFANDVEAQIEEIERHIQNEEKRNESSPTAKIARILESRYPETEIRKYDWGVICDDFVGEPLRLEIRPRTRHVRFELHPTDERHSKFLTDDN
jgi:hypothetical protein